MKSILLASVGLTLLLASTPLAAKHRSRDICRIGHPAYYYQSHGYRPHHRYRSNHYYRYHDRRGRFRRSNRFYRGGYYRSYRPHPSYYNRRHHHRRPRIGIYFEF